MRQLEEGANQAAAQIAALTQQLKLQTEKTAVTQTELEREQREAKVVEAGLDQAQSEIADLMAELAMLTAHGENNYLRV